MLAITILDKPLSTTFYFLESHQDLFFHTMTFPIKLKLDNHCAPFPVHRHPWGDTTSTAQTSPHWAHGRPPLPLPTNDGNGSRRRPKRRPPPPSLTFPISSSMGSLHFSHTRGRLGSPGCHGIEQAPPWPISGAPHGHGCLGMSLVAAASPLP